MKGTMERIGVWSFLAGLVIVIIAALAWPGNTTVIWILGVLGIIVGLINISDKETMLYLVAAIALLAGASGLIDVVTKAGIATGFVTNFLHGITVFVAPGAVVVAVKAIFEIAKSK